MAGCAILIYVNDVRCTITFLILLHETFTLIFFLHFCDAVFNSFWIEWVLVCSKIYTCSHLSTVMLLIYPSNIFIYFCRWMIHYISVFFIFISQVPEFLIFRILDSRTIFSKVILHGVLISPKNLWILLITHQTNILFINQILLCHHLGQQLVFKQNLYNILKSCYHSIYSSELMFWVFVETFQFINFIVDLILGVDSLLFHFFFF